MAFPVEVRLLAALCFLLAGRCVTTAVPQFLTFCKTMGFETPRCPESFVKTWGEQWDDQQTVQGNASNSGRKRKLKEEQLDQLMGEILQWKAAGMAGPYRSIDELLQNSTLASQIVTDTGVSHDTLITRLKEKNPNLRYMKLGVKPAHSRAQLQDRYDTACIHLERPNSVRERVLFIDAKTMYMRVKTRYGWVDSTVEDTFSTRFPASLKNPIVLKYYIAVNYRLGAVLLVFYTGTTGMPANRDPNNPYLVSFQVYSFTSLLCSLSWIACSIVCNHRRHRGSSCSPSLSSSQTTL